MSNHDHTEALDRVQRGVARANANLAITLDSLAGQHDDQLAAMRLRDSYGDLRTAYERTVATLERLEIELSNSDDLSVETALETRKAHAQRADELYDGPVYFVAIELLAYNRRRWLWESPETNGAENVRRHGFTQNQRTHLDQLQDAWRNYTDTHEDTNER